MSDYIIEARMAALLAAQPEYGALLAVTVAEVGQPPAVSGGAVHTMAPAWNR